MKMESHLSVCPPEFFWCHRANLAASAPISTGHAQNESCIFWNMQDYVYNFYWDETQSTKASGVGYNIAIEHKLSFLAHSVSVSDC